MLRHPQSWVFALSCLVSMAVHGGEAGQSAEARYQQALDAVIADSGNPEKSFDFVAAAVEVGDLRGAIAALERILLIDPRLANIQLELGLLYSSIGNAPLARYHIREALRAPNMPVVVRNRAERLLARVGGEGRRNSFRSEVALGYRRDSNANAGPSADAVYALDLFTLQPQLVPLASGGEADDTALEGSLVLSHSFSFGGERGSSWDTDLFGYGVRYADLEYLDQVSYGLETGPVMVFAGSAEAPVSLRLFGSVGGATLDGEDYFDDTGGGLVLSAAWSPVTLTQLRVAYEDREFEDTPGRFLLSDRSGDYLNFLLRQIWQRGNVQLSLGAVGQDVSAEADYQSYSQWGGTGGIRWFAGGGARPWSVYANVSYRQAEYDAADVFIHPTIIRDDERMDAAIGMEVSVTRYIAVGMDVLYTDNKSNLPNYEYDNVSGGLRAIARF